ncbi:MAG TPA: potassium channel family protein [Geobacteraceae bacterium]
MHILSATTGVLLILLVLWEGFETIVLPRRVTRRYRLTRLFYRRTWRFWSALIRRMASPGRQESALSYFGPISLLMLLTVWASTLLTGFALVYWSTGSTIKTPEGVGSFFTALYLSGTTFFTLGLGDVVPVTPLVRACVVIEAGMGFAFLALVIGYLPALNQSFARREVNISLLDARAGSPPTAGEMLRRHSHDHGFEALRELLHLWERWSAELLESHLSFPVLAYFRSQHDNQSWIAAITAILDTCALVLAGLEGACQRQAELTFAMARHAVVDLSLVFGIPPHEPLHDRLPAERLVELRALLAASGLTLAEGDDFDQRLTALCRMYEPYISSLARYLHMSVPPWFVKGDRIDNWQTSAWERRRKGSFPAIRPEPDGDDHF